MTKREPFSWEKPTAYNEVLKQHFHTRARRSLKALAVALGLQPGEYDLRSNKAGIAVSGEITLHADWVYVSVTQGHLGNDRGVMFRTVKSRKDYSGGTNHFAPLRQLDTPHRLAEIIERAGIVRPKP